LHLRRSAEQPLGAWRAGQPVRIRGLKPLVTCRDRVLEPDRVAGPIARSVPAHRNHSPAPRTDRSAATTRPPRWPGTRVSPGRMT
jgi:hypothetical protein